MEGWHNGACKDLSHLNKYESFYCDLYKQLLDFESLTKAYLFILFIYMQYFNRPPNSA